jgi:hypothetical protein
MTTRAQWTAALAALGTLALAGAASGVALAGGQTHPTLTLSVATTPVTYSEGARITAHGDTGVDGRLWLDVIATESNFCEPTVTSERRSRNHEGEVIHERVKGSFSPTGTFRASRPIYGRWFACAYLGPDSDHTFAHARAMWEVVKKK